MEICFLMMHVPNPRMNKRIAIAKENGKTDILCVRRKDQNIWEPFYTDVKHHISELDIPTSKHPVKRYFSTRTYSKHTMSVLRKLKPDIIYCEGLDSLVIVSEYSKKNNCKVIYEVSDLRECYIDASGIKAKITRRLFTEIERRCLQRVSALVITSEKFYDFHYCKLIQREKVIYLPNIPNLEPFQDYKVKEAGEFTVGFIGGIRYLKQMKMLVDASCSVGFRILFAGAGGTDKEYEDIMEYCKGKDNIIFSGRYSYEKEIASLYGGVDCIYSVYDADNPNVRIALPNKLYEAVLCEVPIIVAKNTYLSEVVEKYGVGISVSHTDISDLENVIQKLKTDRKYYDGFVNAAKKCKDELLCKDNEERLRKIFVKSEQE